MFKFIGIGLTFLTLILLYYKQPVHENFKKTETFMHVLIDNVDYGMVDSISELTDLSLISSGDHYTKISLKRDFVTDLSLYRWARQTVETKQEPKDIIISMTTREGQKTSYFVLKKSKPLQWALEVTDQNTGGFHERVDFAVQEITIR